MAEYQTKTKVTRCKNAVSAGSAPVADATVIDSRGFHSTEFLFLVGTIVSGAVTTAQVWGSEDVGGSPDDFELLAGATVSIADDEDNGVARIEVRTPTKRYLRPVLLRSTQNATLDGIVCIQHGPESSPVTDGATVVGAATVVKPAEAA